MAAARLLVRRLRRRPRSAARTRFAPDEPVRSRRAQPRRQRRDASTRACDRTRVRRVVSLDGFGIPAEAAGRAPRQAREMARRARAIRRASRRTRASPRSPIACRRTIRGCRATRPSSSRAHWARGAARRHARELASDPRHKLPFPTRLPDRGSRTRSGAAITAPVLWVAAADSHIPRWLDEHPEGEAGADGSTPCARRMTHIRDARARDDRRRGPHAAPRSAGGGARAIEAVPRAVSA